MTVADTLPLAPAGFDKNGRPIAEGHMGETTFLVKFRPAPKGRQVSESDAEKTGRGATIRIPPDTMDALGNPAWAQLYLDMTNGAVVINPDYSDRQEVGGSAPPAPVASEARSAAARLTMSDRPSN